MRRSSEDIADIRVSITRKSLALLTRRRLEAYYRDLVKRLLGPQCFHDGSPTQQPTVVNIEVTLARLTKPQLENAYWRLLKHALAEGAPPSGQPARVRLNSNSPKSKGTQLTNQYL